MAYKKGTKVIGIPLTEEIYNKLSEEAKKDVICNTVPKYILNLIVKELERLDKKEENN